jgi:hypothetical protein
VLVTVDDEAPDAAIDPLPPVLGGTTVYVTGTASDSFPAGGAIAHVQVQIDDGLWQSVEPSAPGPSGQVVWTMPWKPGNEEGIAHQLRARAVDMAGNTGPASTSMDVVVDTVAPSSVIAYPEAGTVLNDRQVLIWGLAGDGWGVAQVDVSLDGGASWNPALVGDSARDLLASLGVPDVPPPDELPDGVEVWALQIEAHAYSLAIRSRATDLAGNEEPLQSPVRVTIAHWKYWLPLVSQQ